MVTINEITFKLMDICASRDDLIQQSEVVNSQRELRALKNTYTVLSKAEQTSETETGHRSLCGSKSSGNTIMCNIKMK